jgi:hypothetical protein
MKKIGIIAFLITINLNAQEVLTYQEKMNLITESYEEVYYGDKYVEIWNDCPEGKELDNCWKVGSWGYYEGGPSHSPFEDNLTMHFYYFPSKKMVLDKDTVTNSNSSSGSYLSFPLFYELKCKGYKDQYKVWEYKDDVITIRLRFEMVETFWGWQLYDTRIVNSKNDPLIGPLTVTRKN